MNTSFWNAGLERKFDAFPGYSSHKHVHAALESDMPAQVSGESTTRHADRNVTAGKRIAAGSSSFRWQLNYAFETHRYKRRVACESMCFAPSVFIRTLHYVYTTFL